MRRFLKYIFGVLVAAPLIAAGQVRSIPLPEKKWVNEPGKITSPKGKVSTSLNDADWQKAAQVFTAKSLGFNEGELEIESYKTSPIGRHISFNQTWNGIPIFGTSVKLNTDPSGEVKSLLTKTASTHNWSGIKSRFPDEKQVQKITTEYEVVRVEKVWYPADENTPVPALLMEYGNNDGSYHRLIIVDADFNVLYSQDQHRYFRNDPPDTPVNAFVFMPDPLTTAQKTYSGSYSDWGDSAVGALDSQQVPVNIYVTYDTLFRLDGKYVLIRDLQAPYSKPITSPVPFFSYSRHESGFEDVNAYFHIHTFQEYVQSLGFSTLGNITLKVDAHAQGGSDQSEFDFLNKNDLKLLFGTGGVDDAEDADVIVHEYSHFLSYMAGGDNAYGTDRLAMEEGLADYFACSYSKALSTYRWQRLFSWDGNNQFWPGRSCVTVKQYPADIKGNKWNDGELWAGPLMEIQEDLGRETTDKLMLATLYSLDKYISFPTAARLFIQTDSIVNGGANYAKIKEKFVNHKILEWNVGMEDNTKEALAVKLYQNAGHAILEFSRPHSGHICVLDMQGRVLHSQTFSNSLTVQLSTERLTSGVYIIQVGCADKMKSLKLVKP
jgi:hypothetical protein